jgi:hypothetical protein
VLTLSGATGAGVPEAMAALLQVIRAERERRAAEAKSHAKESAEAMS